MQNQSKKLAEAARLLARGDLRIGEERDDAAPETAVNAALAAFGLTAEATLVLEDEFCLWPDNTDTFLFWQSLQTQWCRWGMDGQKSGLDYAGVNACMVLQGIPKRQRPALFAEIQVMERAALNEWAK